MLCFLTQMEEGYELDLTYVTERIIAVSFPQACSEETYLHNLKDVTRMLKSKHADNYLVRHASPGCLHMLVEEKWLCWKKELRIIGPGGMSFSLSRQRHVGTSVQRALFKVWLLETTTAINALITTIWAWGHPFEWYRVDRNLVFKPSSRCTENRMLLEDRL